MAGLGWVVGETEKTDQRLFSETKIALTPKNVNFIYRNARHSGVYRFAAANVRVHGDRFHYYGNKSDFVRTHTHTNHRWSRSSQPIGHSNLVLRQLISV